MDEQTLLSILKREVVRTTGCTDPGSVAFAVARATQELDATPESVRVTVSPNIYKNAICVGVPGTGKRGLPIAAALGAILPEKNTEGLALLATLSEAQLNEAQALLDAGVVEITYAETPNVLHICAEVRAGDQSVAVTITGDYTNIVEIKHNDQVTFSKPFEKSEDAQNSLRGAKLEDLYDLVTAMPPDALNFLVEAAAINKQTAETALQDPAMKIGPALQARSSEHLVMPFSAIYRSQVLTAAAAEARMYGLPLPVMAIAGSGNQGISNFLGVLGVAETLGSSKDALAHALGFSSIVTIFVQSFAARMTAFCGGTLAAGTGVAGGTVYLLGGSFEDAVHAMQSVIGTLGCVFCDGAKESCAHHINIAAATAIQSAYLALQGVYIPSGSGLVGATIEKTFANLGRMNREGMAETDRVLLALIKEGQAQKPA